MSLTPSKIFPVSHFPKNISIFVRQHFSWPIFSHRPQIWNFPLFSFFQSLFSFSQSISPLFWPIFHSPYFAKFPLWFRKIPVFCTCFLWFSFPPTFTMMHLCITQCTYWTSLRQGDKLITGAIPNQVHNSQTSRLVSVRGLNPGRSSRGADNWKCQ